MSMVAFFCASRKIYPCMFHFLLAAVCEVRLMVEKGVSASGDSRLRTERRRPGGLHRPFRDVLPSCLLVYSIQGSSYKCLWDGARRGRVAMAMFTPSAMTSRPVALHSG